MLVLAETETTKQKANNMKKITILAFQTFGDYEHDLGCVIEEQHDTVAEAKRRARYVLSEEYRVSSEASTRLGYSQVRVGDEIRHDFFN